MRILIASSLDQAAVDQLRQQYEVVCAFDAKPTELQRHVRDCNIVVFRSGVSLTTEILDGAPNLQLLIRAGCGLDNLDLEYVKARAIELRTIPEPAAYAVAEMTLALMLALARNLREADRLWRQGRWAKHQLEGHLLKGKTLGIVGAGNIGSRVGELGLAFQMHPVGCVETPLEEVCGGLRAKGITVASLTDVVATADFVTIHLPLRESTRNLIDREMLSRMKPGSFLINMARGGIVDEAALYQELVDGRRLRGAALDVHEHEGEGKISPFAALPNVLLTPHIGSMTVDTQRDIGRRVVAIIREFCERVPGAQSVAGDNYVAAVRTVPV
jgi:D-3-phosphoglycerate dehydrogenase / 2-oxoglutarate reductase